MTSLINTLPIAATSAFVVLKASIVAAAGTAGRDPGSSSSSPSGQSGQGTGMEDFNNPFYYDDQLAVWYVDLGYRPDLPLGKPKWVPVRPDHPHPNAFRALQDHLDELYYNPTNYEMTTGRYRVDDDNYRCKLYFDQDDDGKSTLYKAEQQAIDSSNNVLRNSIGKRRVRPIVRSAPGWKVNCGKAGWISLKKIKLDNATVHDVVENLHHKRVRHGFRTKWYWATRDTQHGGPQRCLCEYNAKEDTWCELEVLEDGTVKSGSEKRRVSCFPTAEEIENNSRTPSSVNRYAGGSTRRARKENPDARQLAQRREHIHHRHGERNHVPPTPEAPKPPTLMERAMRMIRGMSMTGQKRKD